MVYIYIETNVEKFHNCIYVCGNPQVQIASRGIFLMGSLALAYKTFSFRKNTPFWPKIHHFWKSGLNQNCDINFFFSFSCNNIEVLMEAQKRQLRKSNIQLFFMEAQNGSDSFLILYSQTIVVRSLIESVFLKVWNPNCNFMQKITHFEPVYVYKIRQNSVTSIFWPQTPPE